MDGQERIRSEFECGFGISCKASLQFGMDRADQVIPTLAGLIMSATRHDHVNISWHSVEFSSYESKS